MTTVVVILEYTTLLKRRTKNEYYEVTSLLYITLAQ